MNGISHWFHRNGFRVCPPVHPAVAAFRKERQQEEKRHAKREEIYITENKGGRRSNHQRPPEKTGRKKHKESRVLSSSEKKKSYAKSNPQAGARSKVAAVIPQVRAQVFLRLRIKEFQDGCCMIGIIMLRRKAVLQIIFRKGPSESRLRHFVGCGECPVSVCGKKPCFYICFFISLS